MKLSDFTYHLPEERIAQTPVEPRDHSRLLHLNRSTQSMEHLHFFDLPSLLQPGDVLVLNNTRVMPVRVFAQKPTGGKVEILLIKKLSQESEKENWEALTRPGLKVGQIAQAQNENIQLEFTVVENLGYTKKISINKTGAELLTALNELGSLPTPPYIKQFVGDPERYQTVFGHEIGSAAAPTAGLHFTPELLEKLQQKGIQIEELTLHVGLGTFLPVKESDITQHHIHSEWFSVSEKTAQSLNQAKTEGRRIIAVGTTALRTLESAVDQNGHIQAQSRDTKLYVYPPYKFQFANALITNFHLPESTLLMLVAAFTSAPQTAEKFTTFSESFMGKAYQTAIEEKYRFFSFGDAMFIE